MFPITPDFYPATPDVIAIVIEYSNQNNISPALVLGFIEQESSFDPNAERYESVVSGTGKPDYSSGLMQILTSTAMDMGFTSTGSLESDNDALKDPRMNIYYGIKYLKTRLLKYKNLPLIDAVRTYNSGSPLTPASSWYASNQKYGENVIENMKKWEVRLALGTKSNIVENLVFAGVLGAACIYLDKKFIK